MHPFSHFLLPFFFISLTHNTSIKLKRCFVSFYFSSSTLSQHVTQQKALSDDIKDRQHSKWTQIERFNYLPPVLSVYLCCASPFYRKQLPSQLFLRICGNSRPSFINSIVTGQQKQILFLVYEVNPKKTYSINHGGI